MVESCIGTAALSTSWHAVCWCCVEMSLLLGSCCGVACCGKRLTGIWACRWVPHRSSVLLPPGQQRVYHEHGAPGQDGSTTYLTELVVRSLMINGQGW